jgi:RNA polymerase sigma-70 factor (ECF subfamily)
MSQPTSTIEAAEDRVAVEATTAGALIDASLVLRAQAGDERALGDLAVQARPLVQRYARRFLSDPARAEDLAQTALMKAFSRIGDVRAPEAFQAWLLRIARNECLNELARQKHAQLPLSSLGDGAVEIVAPAGGDDDPEEALLRSQLQALVRRVAATLPAHHRQALVMRALEDRSYEEISEALDVPVSVVRVWYFRARKRFRSAFVTMMVARRGVPALCQEMGEAIAEMIEGTLPAADRPRVDEHLGGCHACQQTEDELRNTAFRTPTRGMVIGLGLLRIGWKLPHRMRSGLSHGPRIATRLAVGAGAVGVAATVAGSPASPAVPATTAAPGGQAAHASALVAGPAGATGRAGSTVPGAVAQVADPTLPSLPGLPPLFGGVDLPVVVQRIDELTSRVTQLATGVVQQSQAAVSKGAAAAQSSASGVGQRPPATPSPQPILHKAP